MHTLRRLAPVMAVLALNLAAAGCALDMFGGYVASHLTIAAGDNQVAVAGTSVEVAPRVLTNGSSREVVFTVVTGGGTVSGATQTPDANGLAIVGGWTLGPTPGPNTLVARFISGDTVSVTFRATATAPQ